MDTEQEEEKQQKGDVYLHSGVLVGVVFVRMLRLDLQQRSLHKLHSVFTVSG